MLDDSIVLQKPAQASELVLLFHGVGASAHSMAPLGRLIAQHSPGAAVISVQAPNPSSVGRGVEWFSVAGISEENRVARISNVMPAFIEAVRHWQRILDTAPEDTTLVGFSQGAIMSLHASLERAPRAVAGRVFSLAGRFAREPESAPHNVRFHLVHGEQDAVIPARYSIQAARSLHRLGAKVSTDLLPGLGHGVDARVADLIRARWLPSTEHDVADAG